MLTRMQYRLLQRFSFDEKPKAERQRGWALKKKQLQVFTKEFFIMLGLCELKTQEVSSVRCNALFLARTIMAKPLLNFPHTRSQHTTWLQSIYSSRQEHSSDCTEEPEAFPQVLLYMASFTARIAFFGESRKSFGKSERH